MQKIPNKLKKTKNIVYREIYLPRLNFLFITNKLNYAKY